MTTGQPSRDAGRGRRRRAIERGGGAGAAQPAGQPVLPFPPLDLVSHDELESIHAAALVVLKEIGIDFLHDEARAMLKSAGADVDPSSRRVRFDPALVEAHIGLAPKEFTLHARNPARDLAIGGRQIAFGSVASAPNAHDRAANALDAQSAYESVFSLWGAIMGGVNLMMHGAGWMEGGLQASFEKMALDADLLAMVAEFLKPMRVDEAELALDAMREVGPGGHFFGAAHTQARYRAAFFAPMISDWRNYESWREAGSPTALDAAERVVAQRLRDFVAPTLETERLEALSAFVARRKAEGGAPTDF